ncbi:AAA family ATPase [Thermodesulfobacteriota bacterium]
MGKKKRKMKAKQKAAQKNTTPSASQKKEKTTEDFAKKVEELHSEALSVAESEAVDLMTTVIPSAQADLKDLCKKALEAAELFSLGKRKVEEERKVLEEERNDLQAQKEELRAKEEALGDRQALLESDHEKQKEGQQELLEREEEIKRREADAEAGFLEKRKESLQKLDGEIALLRDEFSVHRKKMSEERLRWEEELQKARQDLEAELNGKKEEHVVLLQRDNEALKEEQERIYSELKDLAKERRFVEFDRDDLKEQRDDLEKRAEKMASSMVENLKYGKKCIEEQLSEARKERDRLQGVLAAREEADRRFGHRTPEEVFEDIQALTRERDELKMELAERPGQRAAERLRELEAEREQWDADRLLLSQDVYALKQELARAKVAVTEIESLRDHKAALESARDLLHTAVEELQAEVDGLTQNTEKKERFPACAKMDENTELQQERFLTEEIPDLKEFAEDLQHRIAHDPTTGKTLYYSMREVRSLLGGMAMSRLHLLQGISGTGKTSLPLAYARAVGAGHTLVEVQAGWRDRQDLIGHFNAFEKRFYESEFLQALYRAQCPLYSNTPYIIVLDEMNLSHPEQYFADLLSALELDENRRELVLMTSPVDPVPRLLLEGRKLSIPSNVWFVGTANHDETTKDFADKTYDRSHVMELPRNPDHFVVKDYESREPVSYEALKEAFSESEKRHRKKADEAYAFLWEELREIMGKRFNIGWGNRLERQMKSFVPVVISAGGSIGEATDHILSTKLLRKIRNRHDNRPEDLIALRDSINEAWDRLDKKNSPMRSLGVVSEELRRLGNYEEENAL